MRARRRSVFTAWANEDAQARTWLARVLPDALMVTKRAAESRWSRVSPKSITRIGVERWARITRVDQYSASHGPIPAPSVGVLVTSDFIFSKSTRSVASHDQPLGTMARSRQRSCFVVKENQLAPIHRSANGGRLRFGQVLSWVVAVEAADNEDTTITTSVVRGKQPLRARVKLFDHVGENELVRSMKGKPGANRIWAHSMMVNTERSAIVLLPVSLVELDACIVGHPQEIVREMGFCVVTAVAYY